jgi:hypothetical protein
MVQGMVTLSHKPLSPLFDHVGKATSATSFARVSASATNQVKRDQHEFSKSIIGYAVEWEDIVTSYGDVKIREVNELQKHRTHYDDKVGKLRETMRKLEAHGKIPSDAATEKINRNEIKLREAWEAHEEAAGKLCVLLDVAVHDGWKDLYPLVMSAMEWEADRAAVENETFGKLRGTMDKMALTFETESTKAAAVEPDDEKTTPDEKTNDEKEVE